MTDRWPTSFDSWLDPRLEIRDSALHGRGTFARAPIAAGEILTVWAHRVLTAPELAAAPSGSLSARGEGRWLWQPLDDHHAPDYLLNHSCDSHLGRVVAALLTVVSTHASRHMASTGQPRKRVRLLHGSITLARASYLSVVMRMARSSARSRYGV